MTDYSHHQTLAELDRAAGRMKGSAFKAFKRLSEAWREGEDYFVLEPKQQAATIAALKSSGRAYASSRGVILIGERAAQVLLQALREAPRLSR